MDFLKGAKELARNPLGIIALFISLIYGFASLLLNSSAEKLTPVERWPLIIFVVVFPVLVLVTFYRLVTNHHGKLYAPGDFKDDKSFLRTLSPEEREEKLEREINESLGEKAVETAVGAELVPEQDKSTTIAEAEFVTTTKVDLRRFREEVRAIESSVIKLIASELKVEAERNVGIGDSDSQFDAFLQMSGGKYTFLEVKVLRSPIAATMILDRTLYSAVVADKFFESKFKLIIALVYSFDERERERVEGVWRRKVSRCPADVELRFIPSEKVLNA